LKSHEEWFKELEPYLVISHTNTIAFVFDFIDRIRKEAVDEKESGKANEN